MTADVTIKSVVLCADDYALNAPTSQGIVALCVLGRLSATSVMAHSPRWPEEAAALREMRDRMDVGLHLDWTSTFAQAAGYGQALGGVMGRSLWGGFSHRAVCDEVERQLDAFEAHWQAPPDHVDGHQHVQQFDGLRQALCGCAVTVPPVSVPGCGCRKLHSEASRLGSSRPWVHPPCSLGRLNKIGPAWRPCWVCMGLAAT